MGDAPKKSYPVSIYFKGKVNNQHCEQAGFVPPLHVFINAIMSQILQYHILILLNLTRVLVLSHGVHFRPLDVAVL